VPWLARLVQRTALESHLHLVERRKDEMKSHFWTHLLAWGFLSSLSLIGCNHSSEPNNGNLTVSGKTYLLGSAEPTSGVAVTCAGVSTTSDALGNYELAGIPEGRQILHAERYDCLAYSDTIDVTSSTRRFIYLTLRATTIWGYVSNAIDGVIQGATLKLVDQTATSDAAGRFEFAPFVGKSDTLFVTHPLYISSKIPVALDSARKQVNVTMIRQQLIILAVTEGAYVDESRAETNFRSSKSLLLSTNSPGQSGNQRHIYLKWYFPEILRDQRAKLVLGDLSLVSPTQIPQSDVQTFYVDSPWTGENITYSNQPSLGALLESTTTGDSRVLTALTTSGVNRLLADWRAGRPLYGIVIRGGPSSGSPASFNSIDAGLNFPRLLIIVQY